MSEIKVKLTYPFSEEYEYTSELNKVNLDDKRKESILHGKGFVVTNVQASLKKNLKDPNGIFSTRYGQTLQDVNPFADRYKCECGHLTSRIHIGIKCSICNTKVRYVDDDFGYFGWITLKDPYYIIHPNIYKSLEFLIGAKVFTNIINPIDEKDQDGFRDMEVTNAPKEEPFYGIGMLDFKDRYDEIIAYYYKKNSKKVDYYNELVKNKSLTFIQSIPVYTIHLRPFKADAASFHYEGTNGIYNMMSKLAVAINNDTLRIHRKKKQKKELLFDLQSKYNELYKEIEEILAGKKGSFRSVFGGRYNFSSRSVIVPDSGLRIDEVKMSYSALVELMQQTIINILQKSYNITYSDAYGIWHQSQTIKDIRVYKIIEGLIKDKPRGIPILINRNPYRLGANHGDVLRV
ncbi:MAG: hypothetical protein ACRDD7_08670 [Peptostreptococcaceae bacterium]